MVHSRNALIPVPDNLTVITELQAVALAIRIFGLDNLDKVIARQPESGPYTLDEPLSDPQQLEGGA